MDNPSIPPPPLPPSLPNSYSPVGQPSMLRMILLLSGSAFLTVFHTTSFLVALENDVSFDEARWGIFAFHLASGVFLVPMGLLADQVGRKRLFLFGVTVFVVGLTAEAVASDWKILIAAGIVSAIGNAAVIPSGVALLLMTVPAHRRSTAIGGYYSMYGVVFIVSAAILGGVDQVNRNWMIPIYILIGLVTIWWGQDELVESSGVVKQNDQNAYSNLSIHQEYTNEYVVSSSNVLMNQNLLLASCVGMAYLAGVGVSIFGLSKYFDDIWTDNLNAVRIAFVLASVVVGTLLLPYWAGKFADRKGHRVLMIVVVAYLLVFCLGSLLLAEGRDLPIVLWFGSVVLLISSRGIASAVIEGAAVQLLPIRRLAVGAAIFHFALFLGTVISTYTFIFVNWTTSGYLEEQRWLFGLGTVFAAGALAASWIGIRPSRRPASGEESIATID